MPQPRVCALVCFALAAIASAPVHAQRVPGRCAAGLPPEARYVRHMSVYMGNRLWPFVILLPKGYDASDARYPVIYHFHGRTDDECIGPDRNMIPRVQAAGAGFPPFIYVFLNGGTVCSYTDDSPECPGLKPESYILRELIPYVDQHYRTIPTRAGRAMDGFSMGGAGVAKFGYKHSDRFCSFVSYSGNRAGPELQANKATILANRLATRFVVGGSEGGRVGDVRSHYEAVMAAGIPTSFDIAPGVGHDLPELYRQMGVKGLKVHFDCFAATRASAADAGPVDADAPDVTPDVTVFPDLRAADTAIPDVRIGPRDAAAAPEEERPASPAKASGCQVGQGSSGAWWILVAALAASLRRRLPKAEETS